MVVGAERLSRALVFSGQMCSSADGCGPQRLDVVFRRRMWSSVDRRGLQRTDVVFSGQMWSSADGC